ncbi:diacylglycerol kinase 3 [Tanacetum coccineum]
MESPRTVNTVAVRSSLLDTLKGCSFSGIKISKEDLKLKITMHEYLRFAIRDAISDKNIEDGKRHADVTNGGGDVTECCECPLVVFINSKSGGRHGPELKARLQELMGQEQCLSCLMNGCKRCLDYSS